MLRFWMRSCRRVRPLVAAITLACGLLAGGAGCRRSSEAGKSDADQVVLGCLDDGDCRSPRFAHCGDVPVLLTDSYGERVAWGHICEADKATDDDPYRMYDHLFDDYSAVYGARHAYRPPAVFIGNPRHAEGPGMADAGSLFRFLYPRLDAFRAAYLEALLHGASTSGRLLVRFCVTAEGRCEASVTEAAPALRRSRLADDVVDALRCQPPRGEPPAGGPFCVDFTVRFEPGSQGACTGREEIGETDAEPPPTGDDGSP